MEYFSLRLPLPLSSRSCDMAELHVTGQIVAAAGFTLPSVFCKYSFETGNNFRLLQGSSSGQTQCDMPLVSPKPFCSWLLSTSARDPL